MVTAYDKILAAILSLSGLASLVVFHATDGAQTVSMFLAVSGAAGVVGLQILGAALALHLPGPTKIGSGGG